MLKGRDVAGMKVEGMKVTKAKEEKKLSEKKKKVSRHNNYTHMYILLQLNNSQTPLSC